MSLFFIGVYFAACGVKQEGCDTRSDCTKASYYPSGEIRAIWKLDKDSKMDGPYIEFNRSGTLIRLSQLSGGKLNGKRYEFYDDGKLKCVSAYRNGDLDGTSQSFYRNGALEVQSTFLDGQFHGDRLSFDSLGNVLDYQFNAFNALWHFEKDYRTGKIRSNLQEKYFEIIFLQFPKSIGDTCHAVIVFARPPHSKVRIVLNRFDPSGYSESSELPTDSGFYHLLHRYNGVDTTWIVRYLIEDSLDGSRDSSMTFLDGFVGYEAKDTTLLRVPNFKKPF